MSTDIDERNPIGGGVRAVFGRHLHLRGLPQRALRNLDTLCSLGLLIGNDGNGKGALIFQKYGIVGHACRKARSGHKELEVVNAVEIEVGQRSDIRLLDRKVNRIVLRVHAVLGYHMYLRLAAIGLTIGNRNGLAALG